MQRLHGLDWGTRRIAAKIGCNRETVQRYLAADDWAPCLVPTRPSLLTACAAFRFRCYRTSECTAKLPTSPVVRLKSEDITVCKSQNPCRRHVWWFAVHLGGFAVH